MELNAGGSEYNDQGEHEANGYQASPAHKDAILSPSGDEAPNQRYGAEGTKPPGLTSAQAHDFLKLVSAVQGALGGCPRQESNLRTRFRKPLLYPLSYGGCWLNQAVSGSVAFYPL